MGRDPRRADADRFAGHSEMAGRIRAYPWHHTALGPVSNWSETLLSSVNLVLASPVSTILMMGPELVTLYNDAYLPTLMERHPRALGMRGNVLWADAWPAVGAQIETVLATGQSFKFDNVLIPVDRGGVVVDAWFSYSYSPIFEATDGSIAGVMCMAQDVTHVHEASVALAGAQRKMSQLTDELHKVMGATTDAIVSIDRNWEITYLNAVAIRTYAAGRTLLGKNLWEQFPDALYAGSPFVEHYERAMNEGVPGTFEAFYAKPLDIWVRLSVFPTPQGIVTFSQDITEQKRTAAVLMQTEKLAAVGRLASSIAHEINNPLEAVTNLLYIARNEPDLGLVKQLLHTADDELRRMANITNQTLAFHKQASRPKRVTAAELFAGVLKMYKSKLANSNIVVSERPGADRHSVTVYEGEIRQVLNNLISNAIDAMPLGGRLQLRSRDSRDPRTAVPGLTLTVADSGTGIAPDKLPRVFDAFYTTKGIGGTGLGLWISQGIVKRHGGCIRLRSKEGEGHRGTVVAVFLPYDNPALSASRPRPVAGAPAI